MKEAHETLYHFHKPERGSAAVPEHRHNGDGNLTASIAIPGNTADTFLIHFFGGGLKDDRYVVERFQAMVNGDIRRCLDKVAAKKGRCKAKHATVKLPPRQ